MRFKRVTLLAGHYGSGKTNIAVNLAKHLRQTYENVVIADIDVVNPYFRTTDSRAELESLGIRVVASAYAGSNVDLPALPQEVYSITDDQTIRAVVDIGGDDRGAFALGRWRDALLAENDYDFLLVINRARPLTPDADSTIEVMREIELAAGMRFTGIINNTNLARETVAEDVLSSVAYAEKVAARANLPIVMTTVADRLYAELADRIPNLFPLFLQKNLPI